MNETTLAQLKALVNAAVDPVWATRSRKAKMREELLAHVMAVWEEELSRLGTEAAALQRAVERFGPPVDLTQQLQQLITPLGYVAWFLDSAWLLRGDAVVIRHDRFYNALLLLLALYVIGGLAIVGWLLGLPPEARPDMQWPDWSLPFFAFLNAFYLASMCATLIVRLCWPATGKRVTQIMNVLFLLGPPMGTALGIYGLWWVDQDVKSGAAS